jgi:hypothetical protein
LFLPFIAGRWGGAQEAVAAQNLVWFDLVVFSKLDPERGGQARGLATLDPERDGDGDDTALDGGSGGGGQDPVEEGMNRSASVGQVCLSVSLPHLTSSLSLSS